MPDSLKISRNPLGHQVHQQLLLLIQRGDLPPGTRVRDAALALQLGVSRTPVREALLRLTQDGVLDADAGRGFRVRPLERGELRDVGAILAELEPLALRLAGDFPAEHLDRLADLARRLEGTRGNMDAAIELDEQWHRVLLEGCPNRRLLDLIATLRLVPRRYQYAYLREAGRVSLSTLHHTRLLAALRARDRDAAVRLLERRWRRGIEEMEAWIR